MRSKCRSCDEFRKYKAFIKRFYGISYEEYSFLEEKQGGVCYICGKDGSDKRVARLSVDHCHTTSKVRGLLCPKCNKALGLFNDDTSLLQNAISYLTQEES
jgi:hypothetical protein